MHHGSLANFTLDRESPTVTLDDMFHDRKAKARPAERAAAARVHAVEALR